MSRFHVLALAAVLASPAALAQEDDVDVTLQVLDDVSDIEGVVLSVEDESESADDEDGAESSGADDRAPREEEAGDDGLEREIDREDEGEGEIEDFDVPEVVEPEDAEVLEESDTLDESEA